MAKRITEQAIAEVRIDDKQAADRLHNLSSRARELKEQLSTTNDKKAFDNLTRDLKLVEKEMQQVYGQSVNIKKVLADLNGTSFNNLSRAAAKLKADFKAGRISAEEFEQQIRPINTRMQQLQAIMRGTNSAPQSFFQRMGAAIKKNIVAIGAYSAAITLAIRAGKKFVDSNARMSDSLADVQKTTNLTTHQVNNLNDSLMSLDTRTSQDKLLDLAETAGRLGITGEKNILGFVRAADQIDVALGDALGDDAIRDIGKLNDLFKQTQSLGIEKAMFATGSALNSLGMASTANEGAIVDFTKRLAGVSTQAGITIEDTLGLGAALDSLGITAEVSSTALGKIIVDMFKDTSKYAQAAGMDVKEFSDLLNADANEALLRLLENLNKKGGLATLAPIFADLGADGSRAVNVLATLAGNIEQVRKQQALSNEEFAKASSVTQEFTTKNTTLAAEIEKIGKNVQTWFISSGLAEKLTGMAKSIAAMTTPAESAAVQFDNMKNRVLELNRDVTPLIERFKELHSTFGRTGKEQEELEGIMKKIGNAIPGMTLALKQEGTTTDELVAKINKYVAAKEDQYQKLSGKAVTVATEHLKKNMAEIAELERQIAAGKTMETTGGMGAPGGAGTNLEAREFSDAEIRNREAKLSDLYATQTQLETDLQALRRSGYEEMLRQQKGEQAAIEKNATAEEPIEETYKEALAALEERHDKERLLLANRRAKGELDQATYNAKLLTAEELFLKKKVALQKSYGESSAKTEQQIIENRIKLLEKLSGKDGKVDLAKLQAENNKVFDDLVEDFIKGIDKQIEIVEESLDDETKLRNEKYQEWIQLRSQLGIVSTEEEMNAEMAQVQALADMRIISEEELQAALQAIRNKYKVQELEDLQKKFQVMAQFAGNLQSVTSGMEDIALKKSEARKEKELARAGNNAAARADIEAKYEQEAFEIKKKYADANFAMQAAKIIATTAAASIAAYLAALEVGGPYGLILGPIAAAAAGAAGLIELAQAKQARDQAKSISVSGGGSSGGGSRITSAGGYETGGYTGPGASDQPAGIVHRDEYVVPSVVMRNPAAVDHVRVLEAMRRSHYPSERRNSPGFLEGGPTSGDLPLFSSTSSSSSPSSNQGNESASVNTELINVLGSLSAELDAIRRFGVNVSYERVEKARNDADAVKFRATRKY